MLSPTQLADDLTGRVIAPDDPDYDRARTVFHGSVDSRPALIARVANATDVARVVTRARETGMELAVRSGGHSAAGHSSTEGGIVLDLSEMKGFELDAGERTAWAETGLTAGEYTTAAGTHGLATSFGDAGTVGIGGITLGGGVGFLVRKHGMTIDHLLAAEVVTADGELLRVDDETHPDLFWALRGGGGNFGVATRFKFQLHPIDQFTGGMLFLPATPEVIAGFVAEAEAAPEELSTIANVMTAPPLPFLAPEQHGKPIVMAFIAYAGPADEAERAIAPLRTLATPIADMVQPMAYPEMYQPAEEDYHPTASARTMFIDGIDRRAAEAILSRLEVATASMAVTQLRVLGGAMARVPDDATAFAHRSRRIMGNVAAVYERPEEQPMHQAWVEGVSDELASDDLGGYVGFLGDEGDERVRAAYPGPTWDRLAAVKAEYDPDNLFRLNQNVAPAAA
jgi:FAD/FMN-containing dehydrogenase